MRYLIVIVLFGLLILLHELAHVVVARVFRIRVERLMLGFGPAFFSLRKGQTELALGAIPVGAHASVLGMNPNTEALEDAGKASYANRSPWVRLTVLLSGSTANYLLALALLTVLHLLGTHVPVRMTVGTIEPNSAAAKAGIHPGDVITTVNGKPRRTWSRLVDTVADNGPSPVFIRLERPSTSPGAGPTEVDGVEVEVKPRLDARGEYSLGMSQQYVFRRQLRTRDAFRMAVTHAYAVMAEGARLAIRTLQGKPAANLFLLLQQSAEGASSGVRGWLRLAVALSLALMAFNLLPLPSFDGGRALLVIIELVTGRRLSPAREAWLHTVGFWVLIGALGWTGLANLRKIFPHSPTSPPVVEKAQPDR